MVQVAMLAPFFYHHGYEIVGNRQNPQHQVGGRHCTQGGAVGVDAYESFNAPGRRDKAGYHEPSVAHCRSRPGKS